MTTPSNRDSSNWAKPVSTLKVSGVSPDAINLNVEGRRLSGLAQGFGQMWQKTYSVPLSGASVTPQEVITVWKAEFPNFWPKGNRFFGPLHGIQPGEVAVLNLAGPGGINAPGNMPAISTGIIVIYADETSFSFMTPEGHMLAGMITFSAEERDGTVVAQAQALIRPNDPIYEIAFRLGIGHKSEDVFWRATLRSLAARFGVNGQVEQKNVLVDPRIQWSEAKKIWHNAAIRTALYLPFAIVKKILKR